MFDACCGVLTPQEIRITTGSLEEEAGGRSRVHKILDTFSDTVPRACIERARLMTESFKQTEGQPLIWRWAKALMHIAENVPLYIGEHEIIVGRANGESGRYGLIYPELEGGFLDIVIDLVRQGKAPYTFTEDDEQIIRNEILPYWKGRSFHEGLYLALPEETRRLLFNPDNIFVQRNIVTQTATFRSCLQWILDYEKVLKKGFKGIRQEAQDKLDALDLLDPHNATEKAPFLQAIIMVCDAVVLFARRYGVLRCEDGRKGARSGAQRGASGNSRDLLTSSGESCPQFQGSGAVPVDDTGLFPP